MVGGAICAIGQLLIDYTKLTLPEFLWSPLGGRRDFGRPGCVSAPHRICRGGATVPLTGFGSPFGQGVKTAVQERKGSWGALTGGLHRFFRRGIGAAVFFGLLVAPGSSSSGVICKQKRTA